MKDLGVALVGGGVMAVGCAALMLAYRIANDAVLLYATVFVAEAILLFGFVIVALLAARWLLEAAMAYMHREQERSKTTAGILTMTSAGGGKPVGFLPAMQAGQPPMLEGHDVVDVIPGRSGQGVGSTLLGWPDDSGTV